MAAVTNHLKIFLLETTWPISKWFQTRRFLWEFPIGSYVKLSSDVAAILVGGLKCRTQLNFDEIVIGWFSSKNMSGGSAL
jgi:hypothetical protein